MGERVGRQMRRRWVGGALWGVVRARRIGIDVGSRGRSTGLSGRGEVLKGIGRWMWSVDVDAVNVSPPPASSIHELTEKLGARFPLSCIRATSCSCAERSSSTSAL